jgi:uncharacterized membrane protein YkoI
MSVLAFGLAVPGSVVFAAEQVNSDTEAGESRGVDRAQAVTLAQEKFPGTVTRVLLESGHAKSVWKVRIVSADGTKRGDFRIDGKTGDILKMKIKNIHGKKIKTGHPEKTTQRTK